MESTDLKQTNSFADSNSDSMLLDDKLDRQIEENNKKRSKTGCFTCRYIKRKCDEDKIDGKCTSCYNAYLECFWPDNYGDSTGALTKELRQLISQKLQEGKELAKEKRKEQKKLFLKQKEQEKKKLKEMKKIEKQKNKISKTKSQNESKLSKHKSHLSESFVDLEPAKALLEMKTSMVLSPTVATAAISSSQYAGKTNPIINIQENLEVSQSNLNLVDTELYKKVNLSNSFFNFGNVNDTSLILEKMLDLGVQNETMLNAYLNTNKQDHLDKHNVPISGMTPSESLPAFSPLFLGAEPSGFSPFNVQSPLSTHELILNNDKNYKLNTIHENEVFKSESNNLLNDLNLNAQQQNDNEDSNYGGLDEEMSENETIYRQLLGKFQKRDIQKDFELIMQKNRNSISRPGSVNSSIVSAHTNTTISSTAQANNEKELLLYYTFFNYFLPQVGPQNTLPQLSTSVTFPQVEHNGIVRSVFKCCGATFLAWCQPLEYTKIAEDLYDESKKNLQKVLGERKYLYDVSTANETNSPESVSSNNSMGLNYKEIKGDEDWIIACFQLLVLRDKLKNGKDVVDRCLENLAHSFKTIQNRYLLDTSSEIPNTPVDRMLLESFVYNYTVSISVARDFDSKSLPNPFDPIITRLVSMLKFPIFENCEVEWLNNPVLGSSVECFIMLAKVSYLGRLSLPLNSDSIWEIRAKELQQQCLYYSPPALPEKIKNNMAKYSKYRPGLLSGSIVSKACYLLLFKILNYNTMTDKEILQDEDIRNVVKYIITALKDIEMGDRLLCILQWALLIIGAFAVTDDEKFVIRKYVRSVGETIHSHCGNQIKLIVDEIWETGNLGILFDIEQISKLVI
ncbi:hypothetical protein QEN19_001310 [Hanseniaspora menglaensis]